jgi:hypothetical protein
VTQYPKDVTFVDRDTSLVKSPAISINRGSPAFLSLIKDVAGCPAITSIKEPVQLYLRTIYFTGDHLN